MKTVLLSLILVMCATKVVLGDGRPEPEPCVIENEITEGAPGCAGATGDGAEEEQWDFVYKRRKKQEREMTHKKEVIDRLQYSNVVLVINPNGFTTVSLDLENQIDRSWWSQVKPICDIPGNDVWYRELWSLKWINCDEEEISRQGNDEENFHKMYAISALKIGIIKN